MGYQIGVNDFAQNYIGGFRSAFTQGWGDYFNEVKATYDGPPLTIKANYAYNTYNWGISATGVIKGYHAFSCSKCHTPHASRLPKLMITNCLDTRQNEWDNAFDDGSGSETGWILPAVDSEDSRPMGADNALKTPSNFTSAQNCHRLIDPGQTGAQPSGGLWSPSNTGGLQTGWNRVTPWNQALP